MIEELGYRRGGDGLMRVRTGENNYEVSGLPNWPRYRNAELDGLVNRFFRTIPKDAPGPPNGSAS